MLGKVAKVVHVLVEGGFGRIPVCRHDFCKNYIFKIQQNCNAFVILSN